MFDDIEPARTTGGHQIVRHHLSAAQAKWERLTVSDYARIATIADLIAVIGSRYSISSDLAKRDVDLWLKDIGLQERSVQMNERVSRDTVTFSEPFFVESLGRNQAAGIYDVETVEAQIDGLSFLAYRIVSRSIRFPVAGRGPNTYQLVPIEAAVIRAALLQTEKTARSHENRET